MRSAPGPFGLHLGRLASFRFGELGRDDDQVSMLLNFFSSSLMTRSSKLEGLHLETLSSQVLEFEGKARGNPIGGPFRCFILG
jgi:hypothetical protein